jgi:opacity protein-like surface antigen
VINKSIAFLMLLTLSVASYASKEGPYAGIQLGYGNTNNSEQMLNGKGHDTGVAGRIFAGYQVDDYLAYELGWTKFTDSTSEISYSTFAWNERIKTNALDVMVKAMYPLSDRARLYAKMGAAYVTQQTLENSSGGIMVASFDRTLHKIMPAGGMGMSYDLSKDVSADISYTRVQAIGNMPVKSTELMSVGLSYSFG